MTVVSSMSATPGAGLNTCKRSCSLTYMYLNNDCNKLDGVAVCLLSGVNTDDAGCKCFKQRYLKQFENLLQIHLLQVLDSLDWMIPVTCISESDHTVPASNLLYQLLN